MLKLRPIIMNGFTKIENRLFEKILTSNFTKRQIKILLLIIRFSYGCQKSYAVLKNKDFSYAQVSCYCIKDELRKLVEKRIIRWNPVKDMVWINKNLSVWAVDNSEDNSERFIKIATKNLPKQQHRDCQNSNFALAKIATSTIRKPAPEEEKTLPKENIKEILKKKKEKEFLKISREYFLKISPLRRDEILILRELFESYGKRTFEKAISIVSQGEDRSFSYFLKVLDDFREEEKSFRIEGFESLKSCFKRSLPIPKL